MGRKNRTKKQLSISIISLMLCVVMLTGTTFAWFTDSTSTGINQIQSGNLDVALEMKDKNGEWVNAEGQVLDFVKASGDAETEILWEPGVRYNLPELRVVNNGSLALKYQIAVTGITGDAELLDVIEFKVGESTIVEFCNQEGVLSANQASEGFIIAGVWEPTDNDNAYMNKTIEGISITVQATQASEEYDSFGNTYDAGAIFPTNFFPIDISVNVTDKVADNQLIEEVVITGPYGVDVTIASGTFLAEGTTAVTLTISEKEVSESNVTVGENEELKAFDVHIEGIAEDNTVPMVIEMGNVLPTGLNKGNLTIYHVEDGVSNPMTEVETVEDFTAHNQFTYDALTGGLTLYMATFSEVTIVADTENAWAGNVDIAWYNAENTEHVIANADEFAGFGSLVASGKDFSGETVKLANDINMGGKDYLVDGKLQFYPIGYTSAGYGGAFSGTFDGQGHTISNIYQNTWMLVGNYDNGYYNAAMGVFGYVYDGTIKNLTVDNFVSEGEFAPTGVIAAYGGGSACNFENIAITNCSPYTYNTSVAGIVGIDSNSDNADTTFNFKNITVDKTNTIGSLWGSWDVGAAGILGRLREGGSANFTNCNVAAKLDVYNDVCANYQYYWYRYCGMMIGTVDKTKTEDGLTVLDLSNVTATNCTVNFGDWNNYYYCEFEANTMASYSEDYQFSRVPEEELNLDVSPVTCKHTHTAEEDKQAVNIPFTQVFGGKGWGVKGTDISELEGITVLGIVEANQNTSEEKFVTKFVNSETYLYRVGNQNTVNVGTLFDVAEGIDEDSINDSGVYVTIDPVDDGSNVSGTFTANTTDWTQGTIQFAGTGPVKVTIQDYNFSKPVSVYMEVVDATNAVGAASATTNNVVVLADGGFSSLEVSNGYTLYGNGFTLTCGSDSPSTGFGAFVTLSNGTIDNVQIVCPNYDYAALYNSNLKSEDNRSETTNGTTRYYNAKSAIVASGNSQILNSRVSGGRAALYVSNGNMVVDNSRLESGAVANVVVSAANSITFRDATLIQKPTASTYDSTKTVMGMSVLYLCDADGNATSTTLEGSFIQNAWADESCVSYMPVGTDSIVSAALSKTNYTHTVNGKTCVNLGFAYMPNEGTTVNQPNNIIDNRDNKSSIPYDYENVTAGVTQSGITVNISTYVYTYKNTNGTATDFTEEKDYESNNYSDLIALTYSDTTEGLTFSKSYGTNGWVFELNVDLDTVNGYELDFDKLAMSVNGVAVTEYSVNGETKPTSPIEVVAGGISYELTATTNNKEYTATLVVTGVETSKAAPTLVAADYGGALLVGEKSTSTTWSGAVPALEGITIKYWSVAEKTYKDLALSTLTPTTSGQQNGTNAYWEYTDSNNDYTLKIKNTTAVHSGNGVYAMPVVVASKLYFVISSDSGLVSTNSTKRTVELEYTFADNNGQELTFNNSWNITYDSSETLYDYSNFCDGELKEATSGGCVSPDTMITLTDGTKKRIDEVTYEDELLVWNFYTGEFDTVTSAIIFDHGYDDNTVIKLEFGDGTEVKVVNLHQFFDMTTNSYVDITAETVESYVGHEFAKQDGSDITAVKLVDYEVSAEYIEAYGIISAEHYNIFVEGMLSTDFMLEDKPVFNYFEIGEGMKFDAEKMQRDVDEYGLYTYEDFDEYLSPELFDAFNVKYMKVAVEKGTYSYEKILGLIDIYIGEETVKVEETNWFTSFCNFFTDLFS